MILLTNHALPRQPIAERQVKVEIGGAPAPRGVKLERIDEDHANAKAEWRRMSSPEYLRWADVERLEEASRLREEAQAWQYQDGTMSVDLELPPHGGAALTIEFAPSGAGES